MKRWYASAIGWFLNLPQYTGIELDERMSEISGVCLSIVCRRAADLIVGIKLFKGTWYFTWSNFWFYHKSYMKNGHFPSFLRPQKNALLELTFSQAHLILRKVADNPYQVIQSHTITLYSIWLNPCSFVKRLVEYGKWVQNCKHVPIRSRSTSEPELLMTFSLLVLIWKNGVGLKKS